MSRNWQLLHTAYITLHVLTSAGYIIEQPCDASGMCHVPETECDSSAANNLCQCRQSFSANLEASQCVSDYLPGRLTSVYMGPVDQN